MHLDSNYTSTTTPTPINTNTNTNVSYRPMDQTKNQTEFQRRITIIIALLLEHLHKLVSTKQGCMCVYTNNIFANPESKSNSSPAEDMHVSEHIYVHTLVKHILIQQQIAEYKTVVDAFVASINMYFL